ncbi:hypothetical protein ACFQ1S_14355 [Kibdelosporangium lantanae]|uniref:Uncharacterized protein n=1 Tax=Kibdelosporangium lantanae TaxID=1497396 RepID=A0ABW3MAN0_9PSEU
MRLDRFIPDWDMHEVHSLRIGADTDQVMAAVAAVTWREAWLARFLLYRGSADDGVRVTDWDRKLVAVLADPYFFHLLHNDNRGVLSKIDPVRPQAVDGRTLVYRGAALDNLDPDDLAYYFLAGFFQNIIDFLRQDIAEVLDGTDPIYPAAGEQEDPGHVIVYASAGSVFEVVAQSRSLSAGREWIGTCPYLFLVHLMTLHNEDLVRRYEQQVRNLIEHHGPDTQADDPDLPAPNSGNPPSYEALRTHGYTYVEYADGSREYYNLVQDPNELHNTVGSLSQARLTQLHNDLTGLQNCHTGPACWSAGHVGG